MKSRINFYFSLIIFTGCVSYSAVGPGELTYSGLSLQIDDSWNRAPREFTPAARTESTVLTQNGTLLDRIMIIPAVPGGD